MKPPILVTINNFCLYLLVFTVVFEHWDPFGFGGTQSITFFTSILYVLSCLPLLKYNISFRLLKRFGTPLLLFIIVGIISTAVNSVYATTLMDLFKTRFYQLIVLAILVANHIYSENSIIWKVLMIYVIAVFLLYVMVQLGYGISYPRRGRISIFGENPNGIGTKAMISFIILTYYTYYRKFSTLRFFLLGIGMIGCLNLIILSGSRGALLLLLLGLAGLTFFSKMKSIKKIFLFVVGLIFMVFFIQYIFTSSQGEFFKERILRTVEEGETGREYIWSTALRVFQDNLLIGVGTSIDATLIEMYKYGGWLGFPHNLFLWILMSTGLIGFTFFAQFLIRLGKDLLQFYRISKNSLFIIIYVVILAFLAKQGGAVRSIYGWIFFAILIGSTNNKLSNKVEVDSAQSALPP